MSTVASLHEMAQALLDRCEVVLATTVGGPPAAIFLSPGLPALDRGCDTLTVYSSAVADAPLGPAGPGDEGQRRRRGWQNIARLNAQVARCVSVAEDTRTGYRVPTVAQITADAEKVMEDGWALWNGVATAVIADDLFGGLCQSVTFLSLDASQPSGAMAGWTLQLAVELFGYAVEVA